jgi:hypothetical protein
VTNVKELLQLANHVILLPTDTSMMLLKTVFVKMDIMMTEPITNVNLVDLIVTLVVPAQIIVMSVQIQELIHQYVIAQKDNMMMEMIIVLIVISNVKHVLDQLITVTHVLETEN